MSVQLPLVNDYPWLAPAWKRWQEYRESQQIPHAMLLHAPKGLATDQLAAAFMQSLHCERPVNSVPCGECRACRQHAADSHPDSYFLRPPEGKKQILVDQVRQSIHDLSLSTTAGGYRVLIIEPADAMNWQAANSLLKTLEEPAPNTLILLITDQPDRLPATILSRCQKLPIHNPDRDALANWLQQRLGDVDPITAAQLLELGQGTPLGALAAQDNELLALHQQWREQWVAVVNNKADPVKIAEEWHKTHPDAFLRWLQLWTYSLSRWLHDGQLPPLLAGMEDQELTRLHRRIQPRALHDYYHNCGRALTQLAGQASAQLLIERLLISWMTKYPPMVSPDVD